MITPFSLEKCARFSHFERWSVALAKADTHLWSPQTFPDGLSQDEALKALKHA